MEQNNPNFQQTTFCRSGCGFYGSESFEGLCSKCHKDQLTRNQQSSEENLAGRTSPSSLNGTTAGPVQESGGSSSKNSSSVFATSVNNTQIFETATPTIQVLNIDKDNKEGTTGGAEVKSDLTDADNGKRKKNRCSTCRKKIGLTGFQCRCGGQYCGLHRYSDKHECTFNYKEMAQEQIRKNNPVIVGEKIQKI